ncbi:uncharacterized protein LOC131163364 [Malania oleifera]|uniref:uncharacterized protein LOC131163364 n=1 Tax=Malania oleifera TaxID=397392 RepID=UPI0025AE3C02|nr:uncharacterized protein LOC131163364 [Malania oleifera]
MSAVVVQHHIRMDLERLGVELVKGDHQTIVANMSEQGADFNISDDGTLRFRSRTHDVFHVSMLKKYVSDPSHVISYEALELGGTLSYDEVPIQILDHKKQELRTKKIPLVKVLRRNHAVEEALWELEEEMRQKYLHLFSGPNIS